MSAQIESVGHFFFDLIVLVFMIIYLDGQKILCVQTFINYYFCISNKS